jgi:hypothetical protein
MDLWEINKYEYMNMRRGFFRELSVDMRITSKCTLQKHVSKMGNLLNCLTVWSGDEILINIVMNISVP